MIAAEEGQRMAGKRSGAGPRAVNALASAAAAYGAKKLIFFVWKRVTGKEPPEHPEDPQVALREALVWGIVLGAGVHTARMLATRVTTGRFSKHTDESGPSV
jgi:hypothetical protein